MLLDRAVGGTRPRRRHASLRILLALVLAGVPLTAWGGEDHALRLQNRYQELRELAQRGPFGVPLSVHSEERNDQVSTEVDGIIEHPFEAVKAVLSSPASWCEFAPLHANVKACTFQMQSHPFEAFLDMQPVPAPHRFEACINAVYDLMEQYPRQLHEMEKAEYLDAKRRERENQLRLQQRLDAAGLRTNNREGRAMTVLLTPHATCGMAETPRQPLPIPFP